MSGIDVMATFDRLDGSEPTQEPVRLVVSDGWVRMQGGPTGYESAPLEVLTDGRDWYACLGTKGRYRRCVVPVPELVRVSRLVTL